MPPQLAVSCKREGRALRSGPSPGEPVPLIYLACVKGAQGASKECAEDPEYAKACGLSLDRSHYADAVAQGTLFVQGVDEGPFADMWTQLKQDEDACSDIFSALARRSN